MPEVGQHAVSPTTGRDNVWDGHGWVVQDVMGAPAEKSVMAPTLWDKIKGIVTAPSTVGGLAGMLAPETGGLSYAIPAVAGAVTAGAHDIGAGKSASDVGWDVGKGAVEGMLPRAVEGFTSTAGPALIARGTRLAEESKVGADPILSYLKKIATRGGTVMAGSATGHPVLGVGAAALESATQSPTVNTALGKTMSAIGKGFKSTRNMVQGGADILPGVAEASSPNFTTPSIRGVSRAATGPSSTVSTPIEYSHLPQIPAKVTVDDLLSQGVPLDEAVKAASKGEPKGMINSLQGLYKSAGPKTLETVPEVGIQDISGRAIAPSQTVDPFEDYLNTHPFSGNIRDFARR